MIGNYELSVVPRCIFAADGTLHLPTDKASIIHAVEATDMSLTHIPRAHPLLVSQRLQSLSINVKRRIEFHIYL